MTHALARPSEPYAAYRGLLIHPDAEGYPVEALAPARWQLRLTYGQMKTLEADLELVGALRPTRVGKRAGLWTVDVPCLVLPETIADPPGRPLRTALAVLAVVGVPVAAIAGAAWYVAAHLDMIVGIVALACIVSAALAVGGGVWVKAAYPLQTRRG